MRWTRLGPAYPRKTFVIEIADNDFWNQEFEAREPLRADRLAEIVDRLVQAHTHVIVLDVDLVSPLGEEGGDLSVYASEDNMLAKSIAVACRNGSVIVIGKPGFQKPEDIFKALPSRIDLPSDKYPCVRWGTMYLPADVRLVPMSTAVEGGGPRLPSLALEALRATDPTAADWASRYKDHDFTFGQFIAEEDFGPRKDQVFRRGWSLLKQMSNKELDSEVAGRIVLIGAHWNSQAKGQGDLADLHDTPVGKMTGVFLHANYIEALSDPHRSFSPVTWQVQMIIDFALWLVMAVVGFFELSVIQRLSATVINFLVIFLVGMALLSISGVFTDMVIGLLVQLIFVIIDEWVAKRKKTVDTVH
jgi:CHASE2 domain-containing sensor protein